MTDAKLKTLGVTGAIDTHVHPWLLNDLPPVIQGAREVRPDLAQDYAPGKVIAAAKSSGFEQLIFVQARDFHENSDAEARFFIEAAKQHAEVAGGVIGIDLLNPHGTERLLTDLGNHSAVLGCRMIKPENAGVGILSQSSVKDTCKVLDAHGLALDLLIRSANPGQLKEGVDLVRWIANNTKVRVIGDHLLKPTGVNQGTPSIEWLEALKEFASYDNFYMKLSGLPGEVAQGSDFTRFWPFYDAAYEIFGARRLIFGSDYPVSYGHSESVSAVTDWLIERGITDLDTLNEIFGNTARRVYLAA
jgi:L-fuconolactonase